MTSVNDSLARASKDTQGCVRTREKSGPGLERSALGASRATAKGALFDYKIWQIILAATVGTVIEWYDFFIFGSLTAVLALKFYPPGNGTFAYLAYLATFAMKTAAHKRVVDHGLVYELTLPVKRPGGYQLRIAVRDAASARVGSAIRRRARSDPGPTGPVGDCAVGQGPRHRRGIQPRH